MEHLESWMQETKSCNLFNRPCKAGATPLQHKMNSVMPPFHCQKNKTAITSLQIKLDSGTYLLYACLLTQARLSLN